MLCIPHRRAETEGIRRKAFNSASNWFCYPEPRRPTETGRDRLTRAFSLAVIPMDLHLRICPSRGPFTVHLDEYWPRGPLLTMAVLGPTGQQKSTSTKTRLWTLATQWPSSARDSIQCPLEVLLPRTTPAHGNRPGSPLESVFNGSDPHGFALTYLPLEWSV